MCVFAHGFNASIACLHVESSCIGNGQPGERPDSHASELRVAWTGPPTAPRLRPWPAASADSARARRRTGGLRRRMERRWLLGGLRSGALEEGLERRTRPGVPHSTAGRRRGQAGDGTLRRSRGRDSDECQRTRFDCVVASGLERNPAPTDCIRGANGRLSPSW